MNTLNCELLSALSTLLDLTREHLNDIETGIEDGTYLASDNPNLEARKTALRDLEAFYHTAVAVEGNLPADSWLRTLQRGNYVWWTDPDDGLSSGVYVIESINADSVCYEDTLLSLKSAAGSHAEVLANELSPVNPNAPKYYMIEVGGDDELAVYQAHAQFNDVVAQAHKWRGANRENSASLYGLTVQQDGDTRVMILPEDDIKAVEG